MFTNTFIIEKLNYMLPLLISAPAQLIQKLHVIYMKSAKLAVRGNLFRIRNKYILQKCGWKSITALIQTSVLNYLHKILFHNKPESLSGLFTYPNRRANFFLTKFKGKQFNKFHLYLTSEIYNKIGSETRLLHQNKFIKKLRKLVQYFNFNYVMTYILYVNLYM